MLACWCRRHSRNRRQRRQETQTPQYHMPRPRCPALVAKPEPPPPTAVADPGAIAAPGPAAAAAAAAALSLPMQPRAPATVIDQHHWLLSGWPSVADERRAATDATREWLRDCSSESVQLFGSWNASGSDESPPPLWRMYLGYFKGACVRLPPTRLCPPSARSALCFSVTDSSSQPQPCPCQAVTAKK
jgi:hypothetical protein